MKIITNKEKTRAEVLWIGVLPQYRITGMNPKASFGIHTLRCAGLFNLPIPLRFAFGIGVSTINMRNKLLKGRNSV
jgi:hypothetical protein